MLRQEKEHFVGKVREELLKSEIVVLVNRRTGITVEEITKLRKNMTKSQSKFKVIKNTLARKAIEGSPLEGLSQYLTGSTGFAFSNEPVGVSKSIFNFCKENDDKIEIVAGIMSGKQITSSQIKELANLPSLDGIRSQIAGLLSSVASKLVRTINEPGAMMARVLATKAKN